MYILKKGRAGIQYNAGKTEALSLETMIRMSLATERMEEDEWDSGSQSAKITNI